MSIIDRDVLLRQIRFLQQLLKRALKLQSEQNHSGAITELHNGYLEALGIPFEMLSQVDVQSARLLLRTPERRTSYAELLRAEAEVLQAQGDLTAAAALAERAARVG